MFVYKFQPAKNPLQVAPFLVSGTKMSFNSVILKYQFGYSMCLKIPKLLLVEKAQNMTLYIIYLVVYLQIRQRWCGHTGHFEPNLIDDDVQVRDFIYFWDGTWDLLVIHSLAPSAGRVGHADYVVCILHMCKKLETCLTLLIQTYLLNKC